MAGNTLKMDQIRLLCRLLGEGLSQRKIASRLGVSRNTISSYVRSLDQQGLTPMQAYSMAQDDLMAVLFPREDLPEVSHKARQLDELLPDLARELGRKHVTRQLLWEEYREKYPDGLGYTTFCQRLNNHVQLQGLSAVFTHRPGEVMEIDFAGDKLHYIDVSTGEVVACDVFIATMAFSKYTYVEAVEGQRNRDLIHALANALTFMGGVPDTIRCDNMRAAVKRTDRYQPTFSDTLDQLSLHYNTHMVAARVGKPRDKPHVESSVHTAYTRIYARLRNESFFSLQELNAAIRSLLAELLDRPFKGRRESRSDLFRQEAEKLRPLPAERFLLRSVVEAKVQRNYHVTLGQDMHLYSVPYIHARKQVRIVYDDRIVEVYLGQERIAVHMRSRARHTYTTLAEHMPPNHKAVMESRGMTPEDFTSRARVVGTNTERLMSRILSSRAFVEQTHNSCLGLLRLARRYGHPAMEQACSLAIEIPSAGYGTVRDILNRGPVDRPTEEFRIPDHDNIRGPSAYH